MSTPYQLLIVDDELAIRQVLEDFLDSPQYQLTFASSGPEALTHLERQPFDLMLLDKNLPGVHGIEVLRRARDLQPAIGVVIITGYPSYDSLLDSLRLGALDYLEKPFGDLHEVQSCIARALRRRESSPESAYRAQTADQEVLWRERMSAVAELGANLSHELKNPLTGVVGFAQVGQRRGDDPEKCKELFLLIEREALRCKEILHGFMQFARPGDARTDPIDLGRLVREVLPSLSMSFNAASIDLVLNIDPAAPLVLGSRSDLQHVVVQLLMNSLQAIGQNGHVHVTLRKTPDDHVELGVSDDGPGIPEQLRRRIFDPFFTTRPGKQAGLGLAICYGIARNHAGDLRMSSQEGSGATFVLRLPSRERSRRERLRR